MPDEMTIAAYRAACAAAIAAEEAAARAEIAEAQDAIFAIITDAILVGPNPPDLRAAIERQIAARFRLALAAELITDDYRMLYGTNVFPRGADDA